MATERTVEVEWIGAFLDGEGKIVSSTSGQLPELEVTWEGRTNEDAGLTSPEELLAAAHASCFAMALSAGLARAGTPPKRLEVRSKVTFDKVGDDWTVVSSELDVKGQVPGADAAKFTQAAEGAKDNCPVSRALKNNVRLSVRATLAS